MKNTLGKNEDLKLYNKEGHLIYEYEKHSYRYSWEKTYDKNENILTFQDSNDFSLESTYDSNGNELTFQDSCGYTWEATYDENGHELTYKDSNGVKRGFDIPE